MRTTGPKGTVRADLIFGLDTKLFSDVGQVELAMGAHAHVKEHQELEVDLLQVRQRDMERSHQMSGCTTRKYVVSQLCVELSVS